jgi:hypothetical protein
MTPRLDVSITGISGGTTAGETVSLSTRTECLSPRLGSKESVLILDASGTMLGSMIAVGGGQSLTGQASIELSEDLTSSGLSIYIGNNYTGFTEFTVSLGTPSSPLNPLLIGVVAGASIIAVVVIVYFIKKR